MDGRGEFWSEEAEMGVISIEIILKARNLMSSPPRDAITERRVGAQEQMWYHSGHQ